MNIHPRGMGEPGPGEVYSLELILNGDHDLDLPLNDKKERDRVRHLILNVRPDIGIDSWMAFDSGNHLVLLNKNEVVSAHFMFDPANAVPKKESKPTEIEVYFRNISEPLKFKAEPDSESLDNETAEWRKHQIQHMAFLLEIGQEPSAAVHVLDEDGEEYILTVGEIAAMRIPHWLMDPNPDNWPEDDE